MEIDWSKQHSGVHQATFDKTIELMPRQLPCMPGWHTDFVPRVSGIQRFDQCKLDKPMYMWLSGGPLTEFKHGFLQAKKWHRFNQADEHRGCSSDNFTWRAFVRGIHKDVLLPKQTDWLRRHSQVYILDKNYQW